MIGTIEWDDPLQLPKHQGWRTVSNCLILSVFRNKFNLVPLSLLTRGTKKGILTIITNSARFLVTSHILSRLFPESVPHVFKQ